MSSMSILVPGVDSVPRLPGSDDPLLNAVTREYFATMRTRIVRGRAFSEEDGAGAPRVIVVNETMARLLWPNADPIGRCVRLGTADSIPCSTVIGVAPETRSRSIRPEPVMQYYVPIEQQQTDERVSIVVVRPSGDVGDAAALVRRVVLEEAPKLSFVEVLPVSDLLEPQVRPWRLGASLFSAFGILALVIAAVGLYSVLAYVVAQRRHEIGVRIALGARTGDVLRMVISEGVRVVAVGVAIGLVIALLAARAIEGLLYGVSPHDPAVVAGVAVVLLLVAVVASVAPAWRASRVDPSTALRAD
jgi:putative ABC transport system permease protein